MSNNKQSSVEWLMNELTSTWYDNNSVKDIFEQAKEMHREEIIKSWMATDNELQRISAEQYYNKTFGGNDE